MKMKTTRRKVETFMTIKEAAAYSKFHVDTIRRACTQYRRTDGEEGLRHYQRGPHTKYLIDFDDLVEWLGGKR